MYDAVFRTKLSVKDDISAVITEECITFKILSMWLQQNVST